MGIFRFAFIACIVAAFIWPRYMYIGVGSKGISPYEIAIISLPFFAFVGIYYSRLIRQTLAAEMKVCLKFIIPVLIYLSWRLISDLFGITPFQSAQTTLRDLAIYLAWIPIGCIFLADLPLRKIFPRVLLVCGLIATCAGAAEYLAQIPFANLTGMTHVINDKMGFMDVINAASSDEGMFRVKGLFAHPIIYGQVMALFCPIAIHSILFGVRGWRFGGIILLAGVAFGLYACQARSPLVVLVVSTMIYFVLYFLDLRSSGRLAVFLTSLVLMLGFSGIAENALTSTILGRNQREIQSSQVRIEQAFRAHNALVARPIQGYGSGNAIEYAGVRGRNNAVTLDSEYLREEIDSGYTGLAAFVLMITMFLIAGIVLTVPERNAEQRSIDAAITSWIPGIAVGLLIITSDDLISFACIAAGFIISGLGLRSVGLTADVSRNEGMLYLPPNTVDYVLPHAHFREGSSSSLSEGRGKSLP